MKPILDPATGFKIGLFSANCSGGLAVTKIPERWSASYEDNVALAKAFTEKTITHDFHSWVGNAHRFRYWRQMARVYV